MLVKKIIMLTLIICFVSTAVMAASGQPRPRVTLKNKTIGVAPIIVHMFYDTQADILCYASKDALQCFPYGQLSGAAQKRIQTLMESYRTSPDAQLILPSIIVIPEK